MLHTVGTKGQVVISKEIRDRLGVKPGWIALQRIVDDHVELYFLPPEHGKSLKGSLSAYINKSSLPDEEWESVREQAWAAAVKDHGL